MHALQSTYFIWKRDLLHWWRDKASIVGSFMFPVVFLLVLGGGLNGSMGALATLPTDGAENLNIDFKQYIFPGIVGLNLLFISFFTGTSIVADREFGILKEIKVAPISRTAVALGKTLGGATQAMMQATLIFVLTPLAGIRISPQLLLWSWPVMFLVALSMTAMSVAIAMQMRYVKGFQSFVQILSFPMIFLSGAFFPLGRLPIWLEVIVKINPVSYGIDALRQVSLLAQGVSPASLADTGLVMQLFDFTFSLQHDLLVIATFGLLMLGLAVYFFSQQD